MNQPNIIYTRVDNRLVHGQVGNIWATFVNTNLLVVVDDEAANDPIQQQLMKMTADAVGVEIRFFSVEKTIKVIHNASASQKIFLVAKTPRIIRRLVDGDVPIRECNIGNMHFSEGKKVFHEQHVYVDQEDIDDIEYLKSKGLHVFIQMTPNSASINV
ncbi:PTS galactosamine transporter subunit IIB [Caproiciproducens sp.]|uniref:PTS galactosamine transporter subunit IIB n=1 Tax=Caproiciproducens sp. TaxID=1954376 RepID=UPI00289EE1CE|nr:PTS galactosamine transporter subunit IIB [Caproiciproducens sp.]